MIDLTWEAKKKKLWEEAKKQGKKCPHIMREYSSIDIPKFNIKQGDFICSGCKEKL